MLESSAIKPTGRKRGQKILASEIDHLIGMRIRIARNMAGKKQDDLAQYLGLTLQQTQKYENGKNKISVNILVKVAKYFQIPISYFIPPDSTKMHEQTINALQHVDVLMTQKVAENWKAISSDNSKSNNNSDIFSLIEKIRTQGLESELYTVLQEFVNSKK